MSAAEAKLIGAIKRLNRANLPAQETSALLTGEVLCAAPLAIRVDNRLDVTEEFLFLSFMCRRYVIPVPHRHFTKPHVYDPVAETDAETEEIEVWRGIQAGDKVKLVRLHGGQLYYVLERLDMEGTR